MSIYGGQHPKADVERLYLKRCDSGRGLIRVEDCLQAGLNSLDKYLSVSEEKMLKEVSISSTLENKKHGKSKEDIQKKHQGEYDSKALHEQFQKAAEEVKGNKSGDWLKNGFLKKETESRMIAPQDQVLCTRNMKKTGVRRER